MKNFNTIILALASLFLGIGIGTIIEYEPVKTEKDEPFKGFTVLVEPYKTNKEGVLTKIEAEYIIELIDQTNVKISNGKEVKVIPFEEISEYIENDNL